MRFLELKVPPPLVALLVILGMWGLAQFPPYWEIDSLVRNVMSAAMAAIGAGFAVAGFVAFRRAKTTIDPLHPGKATSLVSTGVYRFTRNPMYVGLLCVLLAWGFFLQSVWALIGPVVFFVWINYLQIVPEERFLGKLFGEEYSKYRSRVRRWL